MLNRFIKAVKARFFSSKRRLSTPLQNAHQRNDIAHPGASGLGTPHAPMLAGETRGGPGGGNGNIGHA